ncbi:hypothetical protein GRF59_05550 [Paenibacillus sp. HJL G12]|uniref:Uncharacterized protein n=1 Tax=Paenibacillus dendrobii TaxID=2691084 RepID=A0A7X3IFR0_9BACL|nr:hypothetical protein [Paenibacillus dendrobii]MWV43089.1 hypothetical protein [Paenibacillus dendrobii]
MLNGNKSYLISFTALFSKKGYELAFGVDTVIDVERDTQYHLTAPAYSTYNTLKLDVMKNATKQPYTASSLLGNGLKESTIVTEIEGIEMDSVFARVASYLSDIQSYLSGESRLDADLRTSASSFAENENSATSEVSDIASEHLGVEVRGYVIEASNEMLTSVENILNGMMDAGFSLGSSVVSSDLDGTVRSLKLPNMEYLAYSPTEPVIGKHHLPIYDMEETQRELAYSTFNVFYNEIFSDAALIQVRNGAEISALIPTVCDPVFEISVDDFSDTVNLSKQKDSEIQEYISAVKQGDIGELTHPESFVSGYQESGNFLYIETGAAAISNSGDELSIHFLSTGESSNTDHSVVSIDALSNVYYETDAYAPGELREGGYEIRLDSDSEQSHLAEIVKNIISDTPQISSMGRLHKIMYGQKTAEEIQAGLERLIDTYMDEPETANLGVIRDQVITQLEQGRSLDHTEAETLESKVGFVEYFGEAGKEIEEQGQIKHDGDGIEYPTEYGKVESYGIGVESSQDYGISISFGDGIYDSHEYANRNISKDAIWSKEEKAIAEVNMPLEMQNFEEGIRDYAGYGDLAIHTVGQSDNMTDVNLTEMTEVERTIVPESGAPEIVERADYIQDYDAWITPSETSIHIRDFDANVHTDRRSEIIQSSEGSLQKDERARGGFRIYDAVQDSEATGSSSDISLNSVNHQLTLADAGKITTDSIINEDNKAENRFASSDVYALDETQRGDNVTIADGMLDKEVAQGSADNVHETVIQDLDGMSGDNIYNAVHEESQPAFIGDMNLVVDDEKQIYGQLGGGDIETMNEIGTESESVQSTEQVGVEKVTHGTRKKKIIPTENLSTADASRKKQIYEMNINPSEAGKRMKKEVKMSVEKDQDANRPGKAIETVIEKPDGGTLITPSAKKKPRIWLIAGKIASWSIWNWKKTR